MTAPKTKKAIATKKVTKKAVTKNTNTSKATKPKKSTTKPAAKKLVAKKVVAKKVVAKKSVAKKVVAKKSVAKKVVAKKAVVKPLAKSTKKAVKPASKPVAKTATKATHKASQKPTSKVVAKKAVSPKSKPIPKKSSAPAKTPKVVKAVKAVKPIKPAKPVKEVKPKIDKALAKIAKEEAKALAKAAKLAAKALEDTQKKSPRAAKAISLMPPPPGQMVASTTAKASYTPMSTPQLPNVVPVVHKKDAKLANNWKSKPLQDLSDEEVLSMPDSEYMNDTQLAFFRIKLVQLKNDILANAEGTTEHLREDTVVVPDPADRATIEEEHALELRTRDRERKLLKKIEQSITRIDAGDYGYCDETGESIGVGRLLARPTATLSLEAQQRRELKQKMFGD
jgi:DnaK suppressor protein